jgi:beta-glucosidase
VPTDFLGINYYQRVLVSAGEGGLLATTRSRPKIGRFTAMDWEVYPDGLRNLLLRVTEEYGPGALYITENGAAYDEPAPANGVVEDPGRVDYLRDHVAAAGQAIAGGAPVQGYFVWSLLDNFEWSFGYDKRFGIIHVDYATQQRTLKRSAHVYREIIGG